MKKLLIVLLFAFFATPVQANKLGDIIAIGYLIKEVKDEFQKENEIDVRGIYAEKADEYFRSHEVAAEYKVKVKKRQVQRCIEFFECNESQFRD